MFVSRLDKDLQLDVAKSRATNLEEMSETAFTVVRGGKKPPNSINAMRYI